VRGGRSIKGNPDLVVTKIKNYDVRLEWFPGRGEVLALSLFYKDLTDPIEQTVRPTIQLQNSFINSDDAEVMGIELEARKNLGFLWSRLKNFRFMLLLSGILMRRPAG